MIMIVSTDERWKMECIRQALSLNGFETVTGDLSDCKEVCTRRVPALVVADLSGNLEKDLEAYQLLAKLSTAPIVAVSSCEDNEYALALFAAGVDDVLIRPIHTSLLIARIRGILRRYQVPPNHSSNFPSEFQQGRCIHTSILGYLEDQVMQNNLNKWVRKIHRWLVWPFILILLTALFTRGTDLATVIQKIQAPFMLILAFTGAYLWLLPYLSRWQRRKRQEVSATNVK